MSGPDVWGPHGWKFIHFVTLGYPYHPSQNDKKRYKKFFELIQFMLPCSLCANNYKKHLKEFPLSNEILNDRDKVISWGIKMHNLVNISNNSKVYSDEEALKLILREKACSINSSFKETTLILCMITLVFVLTVVYLFLKKKK